MKKKLVSLIAAGMLAVQALALPALVNAEVTALPYIHTTNFTDVAAAPGLPIRTDGNPWLFKGSAATKEFVLDEESDGTKFAHLTSDSVKEGKVGEGSWYFYYRNQKNPITEDGWAKFDIRMNEGKIQFQTGAYTDPTKDNAATMATNVTIDAITNKITATQSNGKINEVVPKMTASEWYTVLVEFDNTNLQYTVTVTDKDKKEYKIEEMPYIQKDGKDPMIFVFAYERKSGAHSFDLTNLSIGKGKYDPAADKLVTAEPTAAPTTAPTVAPSTAPTTAPSAAPTAAPAKEMKFTDVEGHWAKDYIAKMYQANIIDGMSETTFEPESQITRSQFTKLIVAMLGLDISDKTYTGTCTDVVGDWYTPYIQAAEKANLIDANMIVDGKFNPDANITREEMASLVVAAAKYKSVDYAGGSIDSFTDKDTISAWAADYVAGASKLGIVKGMEDGSFAPKTDATRAEAATMISRLTDTLAK